MGYVMEKFKALLKESVKLGGSVLRIVENENAKVSTPSEDFSIFEITDLDRNWLTGILDFLFEGKGDSISRGETVDSSLQIPNLGQLKVLFFSHQGTLRLNVYFPGAGHELFATEYEKISAGEIPGESDQAGGDYAFPPPAEETTPGETYYPQAALGDETQTFPSSSNLSSSELVQESLQSQSAQYSEPPADLAGRTFEPGQYDNAHVQSPVQSYVPSQPSHPSQPYHPPHAPSHQGGSGEEAPPKIIFDNADPSTTIIKTGDIAIDPLLVKMLEVGASDMHLTLGQPIIYRIDGELVRQEGTPTIDAQMMEELCLPMMPPANVREFAEIYDTDFAYELPGTGRFRVNMFKDNYGVGAVLRQIPATVLTADQLSLPPAVRKFCTLHKGLVLVTGPTGSGKSTTLAAMLDLINKTRPDHILTIEDPIEFVHQQQQCLVNQREVGTHTKSFKRALKAALREDPDIVLIGELRDLETIHIALETAETGHLVFGTLHTNTAVSTIDRIIDQFPADQQAQIRTMLASSLKGVIAQTLLKKIGGGRCAALEILVNNDAVGNMIRESKIHMVENHMQTQKREGNILLNESLVKLVKGGKVSVQDAYYKAIDKDPFIDMAKRAGINVSQLEAAKKVS